MNLSFEPKKLKEVAKKIAIFENQATNIEIKKCKELQELVESVVHLKSWQIKHHIMALSDKEVCLLAGYIPHNYWNYELVNFNELFRYRATKKMCTILFREWQEAYNKKNVNAFILKLPNVEQYCSVFFHSSKQEGNIFFEILKQEDIVMSLGELVNKQQVSQNVSIGERIEWIGINKDSVLYKEMKHLFYTYCDKEYYLCKTNLELIKILKNYENDEKNMLKVIKNMFSRMNLEELKKYKFVFSFFKEKLHSVDSLKGMLEKIETTTQVTTGSLYRNLDWTEDERIIGDKLVCLLTNFYESSVQLRAAINDITERKLGTEILVELEKKGIMHEIEKADVINKDLLEKQVLIMQGLGRNKAMATKMVLIWLYAYGVKILKMQSDIVFD